MPIRQATPEHLSLCQRSKKQMSEGPRSAAASIYPHLQSANREAPQRRNISSVADAMYPSLPKSTPPPNPLLPRLNRAGDQINN
jgi:hypothetical protein